MNTKQIDELVDLINSLYDEYTENSKKTSHSFSVLKITGLYSLL